MELNPTSPSKTTPLADRSTNILLSNTVPAGVAPPMTTGDCSADLKAATVMSMEYHRQVLKEKLENGKRYVHTRVFVAISGDTFELTTN